MTLKEFAAACGLAASTVSKALNNYTDISAETRTYVQGKAAELGYRPNALARSLKSGKTWNLGVLFTDETGSGFTHNYFSPILQAFKDEAESRGYDITFITRRSGERENSYAEHCTTRNLDGVFILNTRFDEPDVEELIESGMPLVTIDYAFNNKSCVRSENRAGMTELTRYVISKGHKQIAFIHGERLPVTDIRLTGFLRTMAEYGLEVPDEYLVEAVFHNPKSTRKATEELLRLPNRPTCILMPDDYAALGGLEAIREAGLRVPEDISIAGYDGVPLLQLCRPKLTTFRQDTQTIGRKAAEQLICLIEKPRITYNEVISVPGQLIPGHTVAQINEK